MDLLHDGQAERLHGLFATPEFFDVLDVSLIGATFRRDLACGNVANLLVSIAAGHQKEVEIRSALGASTVRVARQFLVESTLIAFAAASLGGLFASWGIPLLSS